MQITKNKFNPDKRISEKVRKISRTTLNKRCKHSAAALAQGLVTGYCTGQLAQSLIS